MYEILAIVVIAVGAISLIGTILVVKQVNSTVKKYQTEGDTIENQLQRSREYETSTLKKNIPVLTMIYAVTFVIAIIVLIAFIFMAT